MAMTKAEREEFAILKDQLANALAFRRTERVFPDIKAPKAGEPRTHGWTVNTHPGHLGVYPAWSDSHKHCLDGSDVPRQRSIHLFSTEERAWRFVRWSVEQSFIQQVRDIDMKIEQAVAAATKEPQV